MATVKTVQVKIEAVGVSGAYVRKAGSRIVVVDIPTKRPNCAEMIEAARKALSGAGYATVIAPNGNILVAGEAVRKPHK